MRGDAWIRSDDEVAFKLVILGDVGARAMVRDLHALTRPESRSTLREIDDEPGEPLWGATTFNLLFGGMQIQGRALRAHIFGYEGLGFQGLRSSTLRTVLEGMSTLIVVVSGQSPPSAVHNVAGWLPTHLKTAGLSPSDLASVVWVPSASDLLSGTQHEITALGQALCAKVVYAVRREQGPLDALKAIVKQVARALHRGVA